MKKIGVFIILLLVTLLCSCTGTNGKNDSHTNENTNQGDEFMNEPLLTKEEFLEKVRGNETVLGVTVEDFEEVDVDAFIASRSIRHSTFDYYVTGDGNLRLILANYISMIEDEKINAYRPQKLLTVESTDAEYEAFKKKYFENIGGVIQVTEFFKGFDYGEEFEMQNLDQKFLIGRTMDLEKVNDNRWRFREDDFCIVMTGVGSGGGDTILNFYLYFTKNGKFFIGFHYGPRTVQILEAFFEAAE